MVARHLARGYLVGDSPHTSLTYLLMLDLGYIAPNEHQELALWSRVQRGQHEVYRHASLVCFHEDHTQVNGVATQPVDVVDNDGCVSFVPHSRPEPLKLRASIQLHPGPDLAVDGAHGVAVASGPLSAPLFLGFQRGLRLLLRCGYPCVDCCFHSSLAVHCLLYTPTRGEPLGGESLRGYDSERM